MSPSIAIDKASDFSLPAKSTLQPQRTLLLSPPSLSSHPEKLNNVIESHDRNATDMQMLDRLSLGLVSLPESTYDLILVLTDADGTRKESQNLLSRDMLALLIKTLRPGGRLRSQDGQLGASAGPAFARWQPRAGYPGAWPAFAAVDLGHAQQSESAGF